MAHALTFIKAIIYIYVIHRYSIVSFPSTFDSRFRRNNFIFSPLKYFLISLVTIFDRDFEKYRPSLIVRFLIKILKTNFFYVEIFLRRLLSTNRKAHKSRPVEDEERRRKRGGRKADVRSVVSLSKSKKSVHSREKLELFLRKRGWDLFDQRHEPVKRITAGSPAIHWVLGIG